MRVKGEAAAGPPQRRRTQSERSETTRRALLDSARALFADRGFAHTGREEIVGRAGVTRGALYHHFRGKEDLFRAVFEEMEEELATRIVNAAMGGSDAVAELRLGCEALLDAATDPAVQRVVLLDAPAVLGWQAWREIDAAWALGLMREALQAAMDAGQIRSQPVAPLAHVLLAALNEAALYIAGAGDGGRARREMGAVVEKLLATL